MRFFLSRKVSSLRFVAGIMILLVQPRVTSHGPGTLIVVVTYSRARESRAESSFAFAEGLSSNSEGISTNHFPPAGSFFGFPAI